VTGLWRRLRQRAEVWSLVLLALVPSLMSSPGRMPGDTKLYLYLDPGRLVADARWSWDPRQFAGWVPHQTISYLWPSGPWFAVWDTTGVPDWVAHRLWLGSIMAAAGLGARWAARHLGITGSAAWVVGALYQCSPFVLPYVSRTSLMLVTYAALGWLVGLTVRAATRGGWRDPALFALVVATVAAPNATATAMIAPAPVLWLLIAAWGRRISWRRALTTTATIGTLSLAVSVWWIAMLMVQGRHGADVLGYSETLEDVSLTATSTEVLRGLGYWLFYVRDAFSYATTASIDYQASTRTLVTSLAVTGLGVAGLALTRWTHRQYAIALVAVGVVLAVGVHPIEDPSPLMSPLAERSRSVLALALRSSTRAVPLVVFGLALGAGALAMTVADTWGRRRRVSTPRWPAVAVVLLAVANLPALWRADLVDPALERDQAPPVAWSRAGDLLDERPRGYRVLQVPGAEFGAFRWGYTVDPPLPGLTERPVVTRDLLPLGSAAAMDLLYALDDRVQEGVLEVASVAPVARLLGADVVWLSNDAAFDRFGTARPEPLSELLTTSRTLGPVVDVGDPVVNTPERASLDAEVLADRTVGTPRSPVQLVDVPRPVPVVRAGTPVVMVAGSGDGIVDAAAAGLLPEGHVVRYVAGVPEAERATALSQAARVVVTDTDRRRAHHWRSSQRVWGFTEDDGPDGGVLQPVPGDRRLPVFPQASADQQTIARQQGGLRARASAYGAPFTYLPEWRPWRAVDGDPSTAWLVADGVEAIGYRLRLEATEPIDHLVVVQPLDTSQRRWISRVDVVVDESAPVPFTLDTSSRTVAGQRLDLARPGTTVEIVVRETAQSAPGWEFAGPVGFAEVVSHLEPTQETVVMRSPALAETPAALPLDLVVTRWRTSPYEAGRADPEASIDRTFDLGVGRVMTLRPDIRVSRRADDATVARLFGWSGAVADRRLTGDLSSGGWAALDGDPDTAWRTPFDAALGASWTAPLTDAVTNPGASGRGDSSALVVTQVMDGRHARVTEFDVIVDDGEAHTVSVPAPGPDGSSTITLGEPLVEALADPAARHVTLRVRSTDGASTLDQATARPVALPVGLSAIEHPRLGVLAFPSRLDTGCRDDLVTLDGRSVPVRVTGDLTDIVTGGVLSTELCADTEVRLAAGPHRLLTSAGHRTGLDVDRVVLVGAQPSEPAERPAVAVLDRSRTGHRVEVGPCPRGCWLVHGEGYNPGWRAATQTGSLGEPHLVDGGFNGWWLEASSASRVVELTWTPQRSLDLALAFSGLSVLGCLGVVWVGRRRWTSAADVEPPTWWSWLRSGVDAGHRPLATVVALTALTSGTMLAIGPMWGLVAGGLTAAGSLARRPGITGPVALALAGSLGAVMLWRVRRDRPFPGPMWTAEFSDLHRPGLLVVALLVGSLIAGGRSR